jgi:hypothetical protein
MSIIHPRLLLDITFGATTYRFATADLYDNSDSFYDGLLKEASAPSSSTQESRYGFMAQESITVTLTNLEGDLTTILSANDLRGCEASVQRVTTDADGFLTQTWLFSGKISECSYSLEEARITIQNKDLEVFDTLLPKKLVNITDFPNAYSQDVGKPINIIFGNAKKVPLSLINNDTALDQYDYLVGYGDIEAVETVYRNGVVVPSGEYTVYDGSQVSPYAGYAFIRFTLEQKDYSGQFYTLTADVNGLDLTGDGIATRSFPVIIQNILSDATWGLSQSCDTTSFTIADAYWEYATGQLMENYSFLASGADWLMTGDSGGPEYGWTAFTGARACCTDAFGAWSTIYQKPAITHGKRYEIAFQIYDYVQGHVHPFVGIDGVSSTAYSADGSYSVIITADTGGLDQKNTGILAHEDFIGKISYISVYEVKELFCDGAITQQMKAYDILSELLFCCRGRLYKGTDGEWEIEIDQEPGASTATFSQGVAGVQDNIIKSGERTKKSVSEAVKTVVIDYGLDPDTGQYLYSTPSRTVNTDFGQEWNQKLNFVQDHRTADRIACFVQRLNLYGDDYLDLTLNQDADSLDLGDVITVNVPAMDIDSVDYKVTKLSKEDDGFKVSLEVADADIYTYSADPLSGTTADVNPVDWSQTPPDPPTDLTKEASGSYQAGGSGAEGTTYAYFNLSAIPGVTNPDNFTDILFGFKLNGAADYSWVGGQVSGSLWVVHIPQLTPGQQYDFSAKARNAFNLVSSTGNPTLEDQLAPGDKTTPATPTGLTATDWQVGKVTLNWDDNTESDLSHYVVYRSGFSIATVKASAYIDTVVNYYDPRPYSVSAVDWTGNESAACATVDGTATKAESADISDDGDPDGSAIGTTHIQNLAVTNAKINDCQVNKLTAGVIQADQWIGLESGADIILKSLTGGQDPSQIIFATAASGGTQLAKMWGDQLDLGYQGGAVSGCTWSPTVTEQRVLALGVDGYRWKAVGINKSIPEGLLHIRGECAAQLDDGATLFVQADDGGSGCMSAIDLCIGDVGSSVDYMTLATIYGSGDSSGFVFLGPGTSSLRIGQWTGSLWGLYTEFARFDSATGYLGINTTGPDSRLDVRDVSNPQLRLTYTDGSVYTTFQTTSGGYLAINPSGGRLGVGTTSPGYQIHAYRASADNAVNLIVAQNLNTGRYAGWAALNDASRGIDMYGYGSSASTNYAAVLGFVTDDLSRISSSRTMVIFTWTNYPLAFGTNNAERMRILGTGEVGIGTTGPDRKLDVLDASNPQLRLTQADGTVYTDFQTNSSGHLIVNTTGDRVGIDVTTPYYGLDLGGTVRIRSTNPLYFGGTGNADAVDGIYLVSTTGLRTVLSHFGVGSDPSASYGITMAQPMNASLYYCGGVAGISGTRTALDSGGVSRTVTITGGIITGWTS